MTRTAHRDLPQNLDIEQALLGILLVRNEKFDEIGHISKPEHFYHAPHADIFRAISQGIIAGQNISPVTLKSQFEDHPALAMVGGASYLADLAGSIVSAQNTENYARQLKELHDRRTLIIGLHDVIDAAYDSPSYEIGVIADAAEACVTSISDEQPSQQHTAQQAALQAFEFTHAIKNGKITPTKTGLRSLDVHLGGLYDDHLYIIAGRPGMGKTVLGLTIADNISRPDLGINLPALMISIEMPALRLGQRLLAMRTGVPVKRQQDNANLFPHEWDSLKEAAFAFKQQNLVIEDCAGMTLNRIISIARRFKRKYGKYVLFIDYLGLIKPAGIGQNKVHEIEDITRALKGLAKELHIPVVLLCQLSRKVEEREDKRPLKSDLRDSGAIEQDADVILFPYRAEYYMSREEPKRREKEGDAAFETRFNQWRADLEAAKGEAEIIIAKNRYGEERSIKCRFEGERQVFVDV